MRIPWNKTVKAQQRELYLLSVGAPLWFALEAVRCESKNSKTCFHSKECLLSFLFPPMTFILRSASGQPRDALACCHHGAGESTIKGLIDNGEGHGNRRKQYKSGALNKCIRAEPFHDDNAAAVVCLPPCRR